MANSCCLELSKTLPFQPGSPGVKKHCTSPDAFAVCPTSHSQTSHDGWLGKTLPLTGSPSILVGKYLCLSGPLKLWPSVGSEVWRECCFSLGGGRWLRQGVGCPQEEVLWDQGPEVGVSRGRVWKETPRPPMSNVRGHEEGLSGAESEG